tara:strand:+ start:130 stop:591 length:462 start_codon:yes stop_codon:yes gene_type:complete
MKKNKNEIIKRGIESAKSIYKRNKEELKKLSEDTFLKSRDNIYKKKLNTDMDFNYISECCGACYVNERKEDEKTIKRVGEIILEATCSVCEKVSLFYDKREYVVSGVGSKHEQFKHLDMNNLYFDGIHGDGVGYDKNYEMSVRERKYKKSKKK